MENEEPINKIEIPKNMDMAEVVEAINGSEELHIRMDMVKGEIKVKIKADNQYIYVETQDWQEKQERNKDDLVRPEIKIEGIIGCIGKKVKQYSENKIIKNDFNRKDGKAKEEGEYR